jgi:hypothetical protein
MYTESSDFFRAAIIGKKIASCQTIICSPFSGFSLSLIYDNFVKSLFLLPIKTDNRIILNTY